jgi:PAS domain S-box-containing protein
MVRQFVVGVWEVERCHATFQPEMLQGSHQLISQEAQGLTLNHRWKNRRPHLVAWSIAALVAFLLIVLTQQAVMLHAQESRNSRVVTEVQWLWWQAIIGTGLLLGLAALFSWHRAREQASHQALAQANTQMNLALEGGGLGLWTWDLVSQRFQPDSRMWGLLGYAPDELPAITQTFLQLVHPDDVAAVQEVLLPVLKGESPRLLVSHRLRHKYGHWVWLMARGQVVSRDTHGRAAVLAGTDVDRSEQVRLAHEAEESQELLKNMTDQVPAEPDLG